jgi:hypothetical protein
MYGVEMWGLGQEGNRLIKLMGDFVRKYYGYTDLEQREWLNQRWEETVAGG